MLWYWSLLWFWFSCLPYASQRSRIGTFLIVRVTRHIMNCAILGLIHRRCHQRLDFGYLYEIRFPLAVWRNMCQWVEDWACSVATVWYGVSEILLGARKQIAPAPKMASTSTVRPWWRWKAPLRQSVWSTLQEPWSEKCPNWLGHPLLSSWSSMYRPIIWDCCWALPVWRPGPKKEKHQDELRWKIVRNNASELLRDWGQKPPKLAHCSLPAPQQNPAFDFRHCWIHLRLQQV